MDIEQKYIDRFWKKVDKNGNCWEWVAARNSEGYGSFGINGKTQLTHRVSWVLSNGPIPDGLLVCHHCDNPSCVNPGHLFLGTDKDNIQDALKKGRLNYQERRGEKHGQSKLTEKQVLEIRDEYSRGNSSLFLGEKYNVHSTTILRIIHREYWTHI